MCCVMPPASPATTFASRMRSSSVVLPWSTWPITVTIGGRGTSSASSSLFLVVAEHRLELELLLLAGLDEQDLGAERLGDELDHLVGQRLRAGDHLARVEQEPHEVGGRCGSASDASSWIVIPAGHHDLAFGDRRVQSA